MDTLGLRLKVARAKKNWKQEDAIEMFNVNGLDITQSYLSRLENDIHEPSIEQLKIIAKVYNENVLELMFSKEELKEAIGELV